jgi:hypothetical protein
MQVRKEEELISAAIISKIPLTRELTSEIEKMSKAYADAKISVDLVNASIEQSKQIGSSFGGILKGLVNGTTDWKDATISAIQAILQYSNQMNIAGGGRGIFGGGFFQSLIGGLIGIPGFANGTGAAPGGLALVGERGPELVNLPRGSQVIPNHKMNAANGNTVNMPITINAPGADAAALARVEKEVQALGRSMPRIIDGRNNQAKNRGVRG